MRGILQEFKEFAFRSSFIEVAIGVLIGAGLTPVASSLVKDIVMPVLGFLIGRVDFADLYFILQQGTPLGPYASLDVAKKAGAITVNYGVFLNTATSFLAISWVAFWMVKTINRIKRMTEEEGEVPAPSTRVCPECVSVVPIKAKRCAFCCSEISA